MAEAAKILEYQRKEKGVEGGRGRQDRTGHQMESGRLGQARSENRQENSEAGTQSNRSEEWGEAGQDWRGNASQIKDHR